MKIILQFITLDPANCEDDKSLNDMKEEHIGQPMRKLYNETKKHFIQIKKQT